jgi:protein gp37
MVADAGIYRANSNAHGALSIATPGGSLGIKPREFESLGSIDWVIEGGETGPHKRDMNTDWARSLRDQCREADVPFFFKQDGSGHHTFDGCEYHEYPAVAG